MVRPDDKANNANRDHSISHAEIAEDWLAAEGGDNLADDAKAWQDHDIYFGMAEEPEKMLIQHWVTAGRRIKECAAKVTVDQKHSDRRRQYRQSEQ